MRRFRYVLIDVFTDKPLQGNQLAVFTDARDLTSEEMQPIAREMNLSETVFVLPARAQDADVRIRIFTPASELPFAGHPVLGAAFVLGQPLQKIVIRLETAAGVVPVELEREGAQIRFGWMSQPVPGWERVAAADELLTALGAGRPALPLERSDLGAGFIYVQVSTPEQLAALDPDGRALARLTPGGVWCFANDGNVWRARMFAPALGVAEDPATGSAAGPFAAYLFRHEQISAGEEIEILQGVELGRPSKLYASVAEAGGEIASVRVGGAAVVVARGEFAIP